MNVVGIALRSLRHRSLSTALTAFGVALGVGLSLAVSTVRDASRTAYFDAARGYDVVLAGPRTTAMSAVMNAVFHRDRPIDTVPIEAYEAAKKDPRVLHAVPCAVGDVYHGFRVVGTTSEFFDAVPDAAGKPLKDRIRAPGRVLGDGAEFEAVVGSFVSSRTGLALGAQFTVTHGLEQGADHEHTEKWTVVGVLEPTGTPNDQAVYITLKSFFHVKGHEHHAAPKGTAAGGEPAAMDGGEPAAVPAADHDADHDLGEEVWAVSTVLIRLKSPAFRFQFAGDWNQRKDSSAAVSSDVIQKLFDIVAGVDALLRAIAGLVLLVAGLSILSALYNSIQGRRREIAILRALGARRLHVFSVVVLEAVLVCLLGGVAGIAIGHLGVVASAPYLLEEFGIRIAAGLAAPSLYATLLAGLVLIGLVAGALPAWRAYRVPVAKNLHPID
jgi:putative ABC transport system permease protein